METQKSGTFLECLQNDRFANERLERVWGRSCTHRRLGYFSCWTSQKRLKRRFLLLTHTETIRTISVRTLSVRLRGALSLAIDGHVAKK